jgi:hypothetical protein
MGNGAASSGIGTAGDSSSTDVDPQLTPVAGFGPKLTLVAPTVVLSVAG